ncbi:hypothetical protein B0T17DRAFT_545609 [Bombardia bombarda]|uniref:Tetratricopeptide repeat protein n=1 Tax=Bombardia bombarda TaxID=252184 RepID=A0AA39W3X6_9PEZI|nr:hypothetical protein B0T17DRAFT_545609 [Bombardia bombarda]
MGKRFEKALVLRQQHINSLPARAVTEVDINNYANAWHNMSIVLLSDGLYEEALRYIELAIRIRNSIGENPTFNGESELFKALALSVLGRSEEALKLVRSVQAEVKELSDELLQTVRVALLPFRFHWAEIFLNSGDMEAAHKAMLEVLKLRGEHFGVGGRATLDTYYMMGVIEQKRGNLSAAK